LRHTANLILVDGNLRRRAAISHALSDSHVHVEPFEDIAELSAAWPRSGVILICDAPGAVRELIARMGRDGEWFPVVAFEENPTTQQVVEATLDGAIDYMSAPFDLEKLTSMLERAAQRANSLGNAKLRGSIARSRMHKLTNREREVLAGVASGLSNRLIGERLSISPRTVEIHRANMLTKLDARHTSEAIRIAIEASLIG